MKRGTPRQQRGAVTLMGALFLIMVIIVLLDSVQRMAASDITDTALHSDAVEALFIAESGLERAAWRYSTGTACTALAGETGNPGRGNFTIMSAAQAGSECTVRVTGSVTTTVAANAVNRTVEGVLTAPSGIRGWAVGNRSGGRATLLAWDGTTWTRPGPYAGIPNAHYYGVSCVSANDCWAVGRSSGYENLIHWDGSTWTRYPNSAIPNRHLYAVDCLATDDCWAVGQRDGGDALIIRWDGSSWSRVIPAGSVYNRNLYSVACLTTNNCRAVGQRNGGSENLVHWNGLNWSREGPYGSVTGQDLWDVHCAAIAECFAVGRQSGGENINRWDGSTWTRMGPYGSIPNQDLYSVQCVAANNCFAVGRRSGHETIIRWNGSTWSRFGNSSIANRHLRGISMVSANEGYVVGHNGAMGVWNGSSWSGQPVVRNTTLRSVSVVSGGAGGAGVSLVQWTEIIL